MIFKSEFISTTLADELTAAMSFVFEADAEVEFEQPELIRKVLSTETYAIHGQFAAGELYGRLGGKFTVKDGNATVNEINITIGEIEATSKISTGTQAAMLSTLTNAHQIYLTRERNQGRQHESIQILCDKIDELAEGLDNAEEFTNITAEIRQHLG